MAGNWNSGRRKQPTQLKILRGNPGKRRLSPDEPIPPPLDESFDTPPPELAGDDRAAHEWRRVAPLLRSCGLVTQAERSTLLALCLEWSQYLAATAELRKARIVKNDAGVVGMSPYIAIADKSLSQCLRLWNELGLTPSGRAKIAKVPPSIARANHPTPPASKWGNI